MRNLLIVGSGGRECAVCHSLAKSGRCNIYYVGPNDNPGMSKYAIFIQKVKLSNVEVIVHLAVVNKIDTVFIGPEEPLALGLTDLLIEKNIKVIGPKQALAKIETSKIWARLTMEHAGLGEFSPKIFGTISQSTSEDQLVDILKKGPYVVKPDGLHGGKGVKVYHIDIHDTQEAAEYIKHICLHGEEVLIEEKLEGQEFSLMTFTDGLSCIHTFPVQDFKRAYNGNTGPNTGSMGSISGLNGTLDFLTEDDIDVCQFINEQVISHLDGYKGILYGSFIKTDNGIRVIEFNCRFGDPECINILHLLETDLYDVFSAIVNNELSQLSLDFRTDASVFKYMVPSGYPENPKRGTVITVPDNIKDVIYANVELENEQLITLGSRAIGVIKTESSIVKAARKVNNELDKIKGDLFYRRDIGLSINYKTAGVNIEEGNAVVNKIRPLVESTFNVDVVSEFGDFAGMMRVGDNVLVTSTDGVGTKSILVLQTYGYEEGYNMLGQDLVNHCVNDILVKGAKPLFFLDYFASSKIDSKHTKAFVKGISEACKKVNCVLIGGETAEMPDVYKEKASDVVGTIVGIVKEEDIINGKKLIKSGDIVIGLPSSGPHTNGYSLIRKILSTMDSSEYHDMLPDLCTPHKCYLNDVINIQKNGVKIHGLCHITGGGFIDNPPRILPDGLRMDLFSWEFPPVFKFIQDKAGLTLEEMLHVFNCGIGMLIFINPDDLDKMPLIEFDVIGHVI